MSDDTYDRDALVKRVLPQMKLADGKTNLPDYHTSKPAPQHAAAGRFAVKGNAISTFRAVMKSHPSHYVTGGLGGLGLEGARALLEHGLSGVALFDVNPTADSPALSALKSDFPHAKIVVKKVDVTDAEHVELAVKETASELGSVDILCCYAGVVNCVHALDTPAAEFRRTLDINTTGVFLCSQAAARQMVSQNSGGSIVIIAYYQLTNLAISARAVNFPQPQVAYNASKAALIHMKSSLAAEWARYGIRTNTISPGYMDTILNEGEGIEVGRKIWAERNPMGRMGHPSELTGPLVLLCSVAGSYINGADLVVDGGMTVF
ncbi:hypothetical protein ACMFMF_004674 [Clarireedia jacksonii]